MERITIIEVDLDRCSLSYGVGACTASIPATGEIKCFNCFATCQDKTNYATEMVVARYSTASSLLPANIDAIPNIDTVNIRPAKLSLGESIGIRANIDVSFKDSRYPDTGPEGDRYLDAREYDPYTRGTYWGKFRARWPFVQGSNIRLIRGTSDQSIEQMETRHFIVEKVAGPNNGGTFTIQCKDALQLADGKQSQCPVLSNGELLNDIPFDEIALELSPAGIGDLEYPSSGWVVLGGKEVVSFTRVGDVFTSMQRKQFNTEAINHKAGARVQLCVRYDAQTVTHIINDMLLNYANVPTEFMPFDDWSIEDAAYIARNYTSLITEPTPVKTLVNELLEQTASTIWWDDIAKLLRFRVLRAVNSDAALYDDDVIVGGSFNSQDQPQKRVSRVWTYYGQINPLEKLNDASNYAAALATSSTESETNFNGKPSIKRIFSRWILDTGKNAASRLNNLILSRYTTPPRLLSFNIQRKTTNITPELGGGYNVASHSIQDVTGAIDTTAVQVVQVLSSETGFGVLAEEVLYSETVAPEDPTIKPITINTFKNNINLRTIFFEEYSTLNAGDTINITIEAGAIVGGSLDGVASLLFGDWVEAVTVNVINNGVVVGRGGAGGAGGRINSSNDIYAGVSGGDGQDAIILPTITSSTVFTLINNGTIGGGGGGGGGGAAQGQYGIKQGVTVSAFISGCGAGGGAFLNDGSSGGVNTATIGGIQDEKIIGESGTASSEVVSGVGGDAVSRGGVFVETIRNGNGGDGGALGQAGQAGQAGFLSYYGFGGSSSGGGAGGLAGDAINKSGQTVTITNNGTIVGAIVP